jgi:hypothetical protein
MNTRTFVASRRPPGWTALTESGSRSYFDKKGLPSPLVLAFYFSLERDRIGQLVIVHNKPLADAERRT